MSAEPEAPDLAKVRSDWERRRALIQETADTGAIECLDRLERASAAPSFWERHPSVLTQLSDQLERLGVTK